MGEALLWGLVAGSGIMVSASIVRSAPPAKASTKAIVSVEAPSNDIPTFAASA